MKKVLLAVALLGVFMAGTAFASGHVDPAPFKPIVVTSADVPPVTGDAGVVSQDVAPAVQADVPVAGIVALMNEEGNMAATVATAVKVEIKYNNADGEAVIDLSKIIEKYLAEAGAGAKAPTFVWMTNKKTGKVAEFPITNGKITVKPVGDYFTAATLTLGTKAAVTPTPAPSSSSGGGCNAGFAPAMLLLALPLALFIRK